MGTSGDHAIDVNPTQHNIRIFANHEDPSVDFRQFGYSCPKPEGAATNHGEE